MALEFCAPSLFGLEGLLADELRMLKFQNVRAENGRVFFSGFESDIARANINSRIAERILLICGQFQAPTFDALFEGVKALPWEDFIPSDGAFPVKGHSLNSALHSIPDCQRIIKKAIADRLASHYKISWLPETGPKYQVQFSIMKDNALICLDTSGAGLHKRGYRLEQNAAPLRETLAAAMVKLSRYKGRGGCFDVFCGSGTLPIEAALTALNRAPGLKRSFSAMEWPVLPKRVWSNAKEEAVSLEYRGPYDIRGFDIDPACIKISKANAARAGVDKIVRFQCMDACSAVTELPDGVLLCNPPYGERMLEIKQAENLYRSFGPAAESRPGLKKYILSSHVDFEHFYGRAARKKRKLYNGMIPCQLYMYF